MYKGTVLGTAVWSAINEPRPDHLRIIEALIEAGAQVDDVGYPQEANPLTRFSGGWASPREL
jgi:hypothetical protein